MDKTNIIVLKFGGGVLHSPASFSRVAEIVQRYVRDGYAPCLVVSAMKSQTDDLLACARAMTDHPDARELDALLSTGEEVSSSLLAIYLHSIHINAKSFTAEQAHILTDSHFTEGSILSVNLGSVKAAILDGFIPVIAGFQGCDANGNRVTLGRGGADLTAVVVGVALQAERVEFYKDVEGMYDHDPHVVSGAKLLPIVDYGQALSIVRRDKSQVIYRKAIEYAEAHQVPLKILPFAPSEGIKNGTTICAPTSLDQAVKGDFDIFEKLESNVRSYCRSFPTVFNRGKNARLYDEKGKSFIDFFAGAGALNYGHNPDFIKEKLLAFLKEDRVVHALDMHTVAKRDFLKKFDDIILKPRQLDFKIQFTGPTGANSVEAALKLARLYTRRAPICAFTGGWHGMTSGCLAVTGNKENRQSAGMPLGLCHFLPYPTGPYSFSHSLDYIEALFADPNSGVDLPAAMIVETIQGEGGIYVAPIEWLQGIRELCDRYRILLIVDDIQVGCGRSGPFFSFERASIIPDIVCLSKSISGYGLPFSLCLFKRSLDIWKPGQHSGTFRGHQLAFLAATAMLDLWKDSHLQQEVMRKGALVQELLEEEVHALCPKASIRGLGLIWGIDLAECGGEAFAKEVAKRCFETGLILERSGRNDTVLKVMPPLTIEDDLLREGIGILITALRASKGQ